MVLLVLGDLQHHAQKANFDALVLNELPLDCCCYLNSPAEVVAGDEVLATGSVVDVYFALRMS